MLAYPRRGFVFLAMPKCGSSAVESAIGRHAGVAFTGGGLKHICMTDFERLVVPLLEHGGFGPKSYEVVCLFREPVDWVYSWWRYRSRPDLAEHRSARRENFTGNVSFEEFAEAYVHRATPYARVDGVSQSAFVRSTSGLVGVDRIFRYEQMDAFVAYLEDKLQRKVRLDRINVSPERPVQLSQGAYDRLVTHLEPEYAIYEGRATLAR